MTLQLLRACFETQINDAYQAMTPPVPVVFDAVQEEVPGDEYVIMSLSYPSFTEPQICFDEKMIEYIRGSVQIACYTPRAQGMRRIEEMASVGMVALNGVHANSLAAGIRPAMGQIEGPDTVLAGDQPYALVNIAGSFTARIGPGSTVPPGPNPPPPIGGAGVESFEGRQGVVVSAEGDYTMDELGDVDTTTDPPAPDEMMKWDGTNWVPSETVDSGTFV